MPVRASSGRFWVQIPVPDGTGIAGSFSRLVWVLPDHKRGQREVPDLPHAPAARSNSRTELNHQLRASSGRFWVQIPVLDGTGRLDGGGGAFEAAGLGLICGIDMPERTLGPGSYPCPQ